MFKKFHLARFSLQALWVRGRWGPRNVAARESPAKKTGQTGRIDDLTSCRAIFAGWVFSYHLSLQLGHACAYPLLRRGYLGVDAFFVLSGLVLAQAYPMLGWRWREIQRFWLRRLARIYPVHLAMILLLAALALAGWAVGLRPREPVRFGLDELWRNLLLIHRWGLSDRWAWNYPSWSISTEWAGYLAFPLLWAITRRLPVHLVCFLPVGMLLALLAAETAAGGTGLNLSYRGALSRFLPEFIAGMAAVRLASASIALPPGRFIALAVPATEVVPPELG